MVLENIPQYVLVIASIALLLALKTYILKRKVNKQMEATYLQPELCLDQINKKIEKPEYAQKLMTHYIKHSQKSQDRLRNIALLVAYLNSKQKTPVMSSELRELLKQTNQKTLERVAGKYFGYIVKNTGSWC